VLDGDVESANRKLDEIESRIHAPLPPSQPREIKSSKTRSNMTQGRFEDMVRDAKEHIAAGDIFQVVLSQRFTRETNVEPFDVYRAVRRLNPSPYMFFFDFGLVDDEPLLLLDRRLRCSSAWRDEPPHSDRSPGRAPEAPTPTLTPRSRRTARRPEGTRRARHARGPGSQRPGTRL
jgi:hypothetical protein